MDPPLHYAPRALVETLTMDRGIAPVSRGPEAFGGAVRTELKTSHFSDQPDWVLGGELMLGGRSVDTSVSGGGILRAANEHHRFHILGSADYGDDYQAPSGEVWPTEFERYSYGAGYGLRLGEHELSLGYRHNDTQQTGNPGLPTDIQFFNTEIVKTDYAGQLSDHAALVTNPNDAAFFVVAFNDVNRDLYGIFGEWSGSLAYNWDLELGLRYTRTQMRAGEVDALPAQMLPAGPPGRLRDAFNLADRYKGDNLVDFVAVGGCEPSEGWRIELAFGRKSRSPSYYERYLWIPLEVTGGLADGNNYVGDIDLVPEKVYEVEGGAEWRRSGVYIAPRVFYRWVDDYIQGTPSTDPDVIAVSTINGDPTPLEYTNVEAQLYGVDLPYGFQLPFDLQLDGLLSYVRGRRMDVDDDLYRIAPLYGRSTLSYMRDTWAVAIEGVYAASQKKVSATNGETPSRAWGAMNLYAQWEPTPHFRLEFGIDNVLDNEYAEHLAGTARVTSPGVPAGDRVPASERGYYGRITGRF
jgi:outer membrane receptor protein involved in Fe transport